VAQAEAGAHARSGRARALSGATGGERDA
jgi:hypothetical protein